MEIDYSNCQQQDTTQQNCNICNEGYRNFFGRCQSYDPSCLNYTTDECGKCGNGKRLSNGICQWSYFDQFLLILILIGCLVKYYHINTTMKRQLKSLKKYDPKNALLIASLLSGMAIKRKSYCFQLVKQFFLFPDES